MQVHYTSGAVFLLLSMVLCLLTGLLLFTYAWRTAHKSNFLLGAYFVVFSYTLFVIYLVFTKLIIYFPHLYRTGHFSWLLDIPLAYLYMRAVVKGKWLTRKDLVHLVPVLIFLVDYIPFLVSGSADKLSHIRADLVDLEFSNSFRQGWLFPPHLHVIFRIFITSIYCWLQLRLVWSVPEKEKQKKKKWYYWLLTFAIVQWLPIVIAAFSLATGIAYVWCTCIPPAAAAFVAAVSLYLYPEVLYGLEHKKPMPAVRAKKALVADPVQLKTNELLEQLMQIQRPYLDSNYNLAQLAEGLDLSVHQASAYLNQVAGMGFNDYINRQRVLYCLDEIIQGKTTELNMKGIAEHCGFNNRNTFTTAFKKVTGYSPSEYLAGIEKKGLDSNGQAASQAD